MITSTNKVKESSLAFEGYTLRFNLAMLEAGQTSYVSDFYLQECLEKPYTFMTINLILQINTL